MAEAMSDYIAGMSAKITELERERDEALRQLKERGVICASDFCQYDTYLDLRNCRDAAVMDAREKVAENARLRKAIRDRPHTEDCAVQPWRAGLGNNCTCWKAKALEVEDE